MFGTSGIGMCLCELHHRDLLGGEVRGLMKRFGFF